MATVYVSIGAIGQKGSVEAHFGPGRSETITSSGTSAQGALIARSQDAAEINCATAVYATVGPSPTASPTAGYYVKAAVAKTIVMSKGDIVAVIDV